jgi:hypothetical protein
MRRPPPRAYGPTMDTAVMSAQRVVELPAAEAAAKLPGTLVERGVSLHIDRSNPRPGTVTPGSRRFPAIWVAKHRSGQGYVEVGPLSARMAVVEVALSRRAAPHHADALRDHLEGRPRRPLEPARRRPPRHTLVAIALLGTITAAAVPGLHILTRPQPVSFETATARYRAAVLEHPEPTTAAPPPAAEPAPAPDATVVTDDPSAGTTTPDTPVPAEPAPEETPAGPPEPAGPAGQQPAQALPEPGVYRYATTGWEELSMPGSRRSFPSETAQTVTHTACGFQVTWQPLEERSDTFELCVEGNRTVLASVTTYRAFFGQAHEQHFTCAEVPAPAGAVWSVRCSDDANTVMHVTARAEARETLTVAGQAVETLRMRMDSQLEGDTSGTRNALMWFRDGDGLLVRTEVSSDLRVQGPFGPVQYREEHSLHLADPTAHR